MLSRSGFFRRILESPTAHEFMLNSLAVGEAESAVDLDRVAEHVTDPVLSRRIYRHFAEEQKHARLLTRHLESQGFRSTPLPPELDYEQLVQQFGMGTPKARLDDPRPFDDDDLILFLAGAKAGEERACAEMQGLIDDLDAAGDGSTAAVLRIIHADEIRHVSYATEELNRLADAGLRERVVATLRVTRRAEARAHRVVSRAFMGKLMGLLGAPRIVRVFAGLAIDVGFLLRWCFPGGLDAPLVANPMPVPIDGPAAAPEPAVGASAARAKGGRP